MKAGVRWFVGLTALLVVVGTGTARADKCTGAKLKAVGKKESGLLGCQSKVAASNSTSGLSACETKVKGKFSTAFGKAGSCVGDEMTCEDNADACETNVASAMTETFPSRCEAAKRKAAGKLASGELGCYSKAAAKGLAVDSGCISQATGKFSTALGKAGTCPDGGTPQALVENNCVKPAVTTDSGGIVTDVCPLVSGCFTDTGDGTIHDTCTGLQWEKKTTTAGLHNVNNRYTWVGCCGSACTGLNDCQPNAAAAATCLAHADGGTQGCSTCGSGTCNVDPGGVGAITTVWDWVNQVNGASFAGHSDWRLPSEGGHNSPATGTNELETILNCSFSPCINPIFGPTPSSSFYWSASTDAALPSGAWFVDFLLGNVLNGNKGSANYVRAVR